MKLPLEEYVIKIEKGLLEKLPKELKEYKDRRIVFITDENVNKLYGENILEDLKKKSFKVERILIPPGEGSKSISQLEDIYRQLIDAKITRGDLIITLGGGVVGDLGGFAAATFLRGVPFMQIPTTLLAQIDSSIGGKVAINLPEGKNLIGNFYQPKAVWIDPNVLSTLEDKEFYSGMAEVIKYGCIKDKELFHELLSFKDKNELLLHMEEIIYRSCKIKKEIVQRDEKDHGERMLLNFGHTLGHGVEKYYNYQGCTHGEGVAMGMYTLTKRSEEMGMTKKGTSLSIKEILEKYHLPYEMPEISEEEIIKTLEVDKKTVGDSMHLVLLEEIGKGFLKEIKAKDIKNYI